MSERHPHWHAALELTPAFHDLDVMEVVWHGHYVKYFELARSQLFSQIDYDYPEMRESGYLWPIVDMRLKYVRPLRFRQRVRVSAHIAEWEMRLKINYRIEDAESGEKLTEGYTVHMAVDMHSGEAVFPTPPVLHRKLGVESPR